MKKRCTAGIVCFILLICLTAYARDLQDLHVVGLYYNPDGGKYYHIDVNCSSVSPEYLPLVPITDKWPQRNLSPCPYCVQNDMSVYSVEGGSTKMPRLQLDVFTTTLKVPEWEDNQVYRIHITDKDRPGHVFGDLLFPSAQSMIGEVPFIRVQDVNFDGYPDIKALRIQAAANEFSTFFIYSSVDGRYHYEPVLNDLSAYTLYPNERLITNYIHDSAVTGIRQIYLVGEDERPKLFRQASVLYDERSDFDKIRIRVTEYDSVSALNVLLDETQFPFLDEADYRERSIRWLNVFYRDIPENVVRNEMGE